MKKNKLLSIVVPSWNSRDYIYKFFTPLESLFNNPLVEIIFVEDGSTDGSKNEKKKIESSFPKLITIFSEKNIGVGNARNLGVKRSTGKWIWFCDIDDTITNIKELNDFIKNDLPKINDVDMIHFSNYIYRKNKLKIDKDSVNKKRNNSIYTLKNYRGVKFNYPPWNKMFTRKIFEKFFWENIIHEDMFMYSVLLFSGKKVLYINKLFYIYNKHDHGLRKKQEKISVSTVNLANNKNQDYITNFCKLVIMTTTYRKLPKKMKEDYKLLFKKYKTSEIYKWAFSKNIFYKIAFILLKLRFWFILYFA